MRVRLSQLRVVGIKFGLAFILDHLGLDVYSTIKYPVGSIEVKVKPHPSWKRLEKGTIKELNCIKYISNVIKEGYTVLVVGGWIGHYTLLFSKLAPRGQIYAFEPDSEAHSILCKNVDRNHLQNVHIERIALSNSEGKTKFFAYGQSGSSLIKHRQEGDVREEIVETTTLDKYCEENNIRPDLIKIDVEGAEARALLCEIS